MSSSLAVNGKFKLRTAIKERLPKKIAWIEPGITEKDEVLKKLGKPDKAEKSFFYNISGLDYDTTISFKKDKVAYIFHSPVQTIAFSEIQKLLPVGQTKKADQTVIPEQPLHERGRVFNVTVEAEGVLIRVSNTKLKMVESFTLWQPGKKAP